MIIKERKEFEQFLKKLARQEEVTLDAETTGLKVWLEDRLCGLGFSFKDGTTYYLPFRHSRFDKSMGLLAILDDELPDLNLPIKWMQEIWEPLHKVGTIIGHNIKFDLAVMTHDGYEVPFEQKIEDTRSGARLYFKEKHADLSLENIVSTLLGANIAEWKAKFTEYLISRGIKDHYDQAEPDILGDYCEKDCAYTYRARNELLAFAKSTDQADVYRTEADVIKVLWHMERDGLMLDLEYISRALVECKAACEILMGEIIKITGEPINPWSEPDLTKVFEAVGQKVIAKTETGLPSWTNVVLEKVKHPLAKLIMDWRKIDKMVSTFFEPYSKNPSGYVHPSFNPAGTITGRLSCSDPNPQQVSRIEEWDIECLPNFDIQVRRMFIAPPGYKMLLADYSQMEMIGFADYLSDNSLRAELNKGMVDYHTLASDLIFEATGIKLVRQDAKAVSLGLIYGMGKEKLAKRLVKSEAEAQAIKEAFFKAFPTARPFIDKVHSTIKSRGFVHNRFKRRYYIEEDHVYAGVNYLVQGTCADIIKRAMVRLFNALHERGFKSRLAFQLHDEFCLYVWESEWDEVVKLVIEIMEDTILQTKLFVDISAAENWSDKKKVCKLCYQIKGDEHTC